MNEFDNYIKAKVKEEKVKIPDNVKAKIEETLSALPEKEYKTAKVRVFPKIAKVAACFVFVCLVFLPNVITSYAQALEKIPVISSIVRVVTIRNYFYSDNNHKMDINVPKIESEANDAADYINNDVDELTKILADRFDQELKEIGNEVHSSIHVNYDVVTNTEKWFTLKIEVFEAAGSSNTYYKYYHIDKLNGKIVQLGDLTENDEFYTVIENEIKQQMRALMDSNQDLIYWVDDSPFGQDSVKLDATHNFYWNENGDIVIVFDKYEVAPGSMGTPEFAISKKTLKDVLKEEYR